MCELHSIVSSDSWVIYGLYDVNDPRIRYVGCTKNSLQKRFCKHVYDSKQLPLRRRVYKWIKHIGIENVRVRVLEHCPEDIDYLYYAERFWIFSFRELGYNLVNGDNGGRGGPGRPKTPEWLSFMSERMTGEGNPMFGTRRFGSDNPMYGRTGVSAPAYGRVGALHPMHGKTHSDEARNKMSISQKGKNNGFYSKKHSPQSREKISKALKGKPSMISIDGRQRISNSSKKSSHVRWHVNRNIKKDGCEFCD